MQAQNPKVKGSNPSPATIETAGRPHSLEWGLLLSGSSRRALSHHASTGTLDRVEYGIYRLRRAGPDSASATSRRWWSMTSATPCRRWPMSPSLGASVAPGRACLSTWRRSTLMSGL